MDIVDSPQTGQVHLHSERFSPKKWAELKAYLLNVRRPLAPPELKVLGLEPEKIRSARLEKLEELETLVVFTGR